MSNRVGFLSIVCLFSLAAQAADEPQWLKDARAREGKTGKALELKSKDKWFSAKVPAKVIGDIEKVEGSYTVELNIGSEQSAYCEVMPDGFDMADMVRRNLEFTMEQVAKTQGTVELRHLEAIDAGVFGNVPYLQTQWIYRVNDKGEQRLGGLKQISMVKDDKGIYCAHVDLGYNKTFAAVARAFADTFESTTPGPKPYYEEISVATMNGMKIGIALSTLVRDAEGDTEATQTTSLLAPLPQGAMHSQDGVHQEWIRPDSSMINATHFVASNGELTTSLGLKIKDDAWIIEGDHDGKKIAETLKADAQPGTWVAQAFAIRKLLATPNPVGAEHTMPQWMTDNPTKLSDAKTKVLGKAGDKQYKAFVTAGEMNANVTIETATGMIDV
ncbi:MAG TPA: hypothetical protein VIV63_13315, partial [Steroidobacteraceae bacterium]